MNVRWLVFGACVMACASTETLPDQTPDDARAMPAPMDSGLDAAAPTTPDAGPCADCEYFPDVCSADALCPNGPFDPSTSGGALDSRLRINVIRGRSVNDVWAAGALGAVAHFDGASWRLFETGPEVGSGESLHGLWLRDAGEVALARLSAIYARNLDLPDAGTPPSAGGWTFHRPTVPASISGMRVEFTWSAPGGEWLWCAVNRTGGGGGLWRMRQSPSTMFDVQTGVTAENMRSALTKSLHGASADTMWAVGESGASVLVTGADGDTPRARSFNTQTWNALNGVWVASPSEVWAVGTAGTVRHYTGDPSLWDIVADVPTTEDLNAVWGSGSADVWAVGNAGVVLHYDGTRWSRVKIAGLGSRRPDLTTVWVAAAGHVWVGGQGVVLSLGGKP